MLLLGVGAIVDVDRHLFLRTGPEVAGEGTESNHTEPRQLGRAIAALVDVPGEDAFTSVVGRRLCKRAGAWDVAPANVEPIALGVPLRNVSHRRPPFTA